MCSSDLEKSQHLLEQDMDLNGASSNSSSSLPTTHFCLMAKGSEVAPTSNPNCDDVDEDSHEEQFDFESLTKMGEMVLRALPKGSKAIPPLCEINAYVIKSREIIEDLETQFDDKCKIEREDAMEKASLRMPLRKSKSFECLLRRNLNLLMNQMILSLLKSLRKEIMLLLNIKCLRRKKLNLVLAMLD